MLEKWKFWPEMRWKNGNNESKCVGKVEILV